MCVGWVRVHLSRVGVVGWYNMIVGQGNIRGGGRWWWGVCVGGGGGVGWVRIHLSRVGVVAGV